MESLYKKADNLLLAIEGKSKIDAREEIVKLLKGGPELLDYTQDLTVKDIAYIKSMAVTEIQNLNTNFYRKLASDLTTYCYIMGVMAFLRSKCKVNFTLNYVNFKKKKDLL